MTLKKALLAATILALPVAAQAQPVSGLYVGAGVGGNSMWIASSTAASGEDEDQDGSRASARWARASATACAPSSRATTAPTT